MNGAIPLIPLYAFKQGQEKNHTFVLSNIIQLLLACSDSTQGFHTSAFSCNQTQALHTFGVSHHHEKATLLTVL